MHLVRLHVSDNGLTWFSLFDLFGRQSECGEQLYYYFDHYLVHCRSRWDPCIYIESLQKMFD